MTDPATLSSIPHHGKLAARLLALAAALMWSSSGLFAKADLFAAWPTDVRGPLFAFWRAVFATLVLIPLVRRPRWDPRLGPLAICFTLMNVTYLTAMVQTTAANAIWLQSTCPWWVFLFSVFLMRQPIVVRDLVPLGFGVAGVGLILLFELSQGEASAGVACGVASGVFYAGVVISMSFLCHEDPAWLVALNHAVTAAVLFPWVVYLGRWPSLGQLGVLACFGIFQMAIPYVLLLRSLRTISNQEVVAIGLVEPVLMPLWVFLVWHERPKAWTIAGAGLILVGLVLRYVVVELFLRETATGESQPQE